MKDESKRIIPTDYPPFTEENAIKAIDGTTITLEQPLRMDHTADDPRFRAEVANLSRNVIVESADPDGILVSESTYRLIKHVVQADSTEAFQIKGKSESVRGYRIKSVQPYPVVVR